MAKEKKWAGFKGLLPQWENQDKPWFQQVKDFETTIATKSLIDLCMEFRDIKLIKEKLEEEVKELNVKLEAYNNQLVDRLENSEQESVKLKTGETFFLKEEPYTKVVDSAANKKWFEENGMSEMLSVQWTSENALVKERLKNGQPLPAGVEVFMKSTVSMRKG